MNPSDVVNPPPSPRVLDFPGATTVVIGVILTALLLVVVNRFDPTKGALTISLLIVLAMIAMASVGMFYTIPMDPVTTEVIGGLVAGFGAVVVYWLSRPPPPPSGSP